jgi:cell division protein FtsI (penicillin-binding protein 3)
MPLMQRRIGLLFALFSCLLVLAGLRTAYLGAVQSGKLRQAAATQQLSVVVIPASRGAILDRNGVGLAVSEPAADIAATPYLVRDPVSAAQRIAPLLGADPNTIALDLAKRSTGFVYLARQVPIIAATAVRRLKIPGLTFISTSARTYPASWLASQLLGSVGIDGQGLSGLEYSSDHVLRGVAGQRRVTSDALGQPIAIRDTVPDRPGKSIGLTLDATIQTRAEDVLAQVGSSYRPKSATAIVMDPRTNEILALANWPRVNANDVGGAPPADRMNRAVGFDYEPGSTFKAFTVAGALQEGLVTPSTSFDLAPQIQVADRVIGESHARPAETLTTAQILAQSSNVGAITIGLRLGRAAFDGWVRRFGFGRPTGVDLPGEERGQVLTLDKYSGSSMGNLPIGQGESVTPIQMATAYAAIANGGVLRPAHIVRSVGGRVLPLPHGHRVISSAVASQLREMLRGVFAPGGTASEVSIPGYQLAGKTGTANKIDPTTGQYSSSRYVASFMGFAPARDPKLLVAVIADEPQGAIYGGVVAAPAFGQIMSFALQYLRIPPS